MDAPNTLAARLRKRAENNLGEIYTAADRELDMAVVDRLPAPDVGVGLTRWDIHYDEKTEDPNGEWVRYEDVVLLIAAARAVPADVVLETTAETRAELAKRLRKVSPQPWSTDCEKNDGVYGEGAAAAEGFDSYFIIDANSRRVADTINSDATVEVEYDEDGTHAWDEAGRQNLELIVLLRNEAGHLLHDHNTLTAALAASTAREKAKDEEIAEREKLLTSIKAYALGALDDADDLPDGWTPDYEVVLVQIGEKIDAALSGRKPDTKEGM